MLRKQFLLVIIASLIILLVHHVFFQPPVPYVQRPKHLIVPKVINDSIVNTHSLESFEFKLNVTHAFIDSVYYYPTSKSLGANAIAFVMAIDHKNHDIQNHTFTVISSNSTVALTSTATSQMEGELTCRYRTLMARTNGVENLRKVEIESNGVRVEVPFKMARYTAPKPVVICISPQFVAEQWQTFLMHVHVANRFGAHMHIYIISIIESYFHLMQEYERQGYITLDYWIRMKFSRSQTPYFEPNENVEWRHQAGADTDCLLQYKEAAEFVAFFDIDDILFPKNYPSYLEEFNAVLAAHPGTNNLLYGRRETEFVKAETLATFSFTELVASLKSSPLTKLGKAVARTRTYNSTWTHFSEHVDPKENVVVLSPVMLHVQLPVDKDKTRNYAKNSLKFEFGALTETIRPEDVKAIEEDVLRIKNLTVIKALTHFLPDRDFYFDIIFKCYYDVYYGPAYVTNVGVKGCPNADVCELPQRDDYKCVHSAAEYFSGGDMQPVTFHFARDLHWSRAIGCYQ